MPAHKKLIVIPARYASTRFPGKMLSTVLGKPLIEHTLKNAQKAKAIKNIFVTSDHKEILKVAQDLGAETVFTSKSCPNGTVRAFQALQKLDNITKSTIIINLQGDEPTLDPKAIDRLCRYMEQNPQVKMSTLAAPLNNSKAVSDPNIVKCIFDSNNNAIYFSRAPIPYSRNSSKVTYYQHIGVYAFRYDFLEKYCKLKPSKLQKIEDLEQLKVLENGFKIKILLIDSPSIGVDHPEDIKKVRKYLCQ